MFPLPPRQEARYRCTAEYCFWAKHTMQKCYAQVRENLKQNTKRMKKNYDKLVKPLGEDLVQKFVLLHRPPSHKLQCQWRGPYLCQERISDQNFVLQIDPGDATKTMRVHADQLKLYLGKRTPPGWEGLKDQQCSTDSSHDNCSSSDHNSDEAEQNDSVEEEATEDLDENEPNIQPDLVTDSPSSGEESDQDDVRRSYRERRPVKRLICD